MIRDVTIIVSVLISVISVGFGLYKNIEAGNAKGYAYEQAYRVLGVVQEANISATAKANITEAALATFGTPPPVIDLSRSSADVGDSGVCTEAEKAVCATLGDQLAAANAICQRERITLCSIADSIKTSIIQQQCFKCF